MEYKGYEQFLTVLGLKEGDNVKIMIKKAEKPEEQKKEVD